MAVVAIPTTYQGVRFRSRLEAKWAALFDRLNWRWDYEPQDFDGYQPDFILRFRVPIFVEVKPLNWDESERDEEIMQAARSKIVRAGIKGEVLLLGTHIVLPSDLGPNPYQRIGQLMDVNPTTDEVSPWGWAFGFECTHCHSHSFGSEDNSWHCRVRGCYDEHNSKDHMDGWDALAAFREASAEVQWRPR
jgi:hypothetical protein